MKLRLVLPRVHNGLVLLVLLGALPIALVKLMRTVIDTVVELMQAATDAIVELV